MTAQAKHGWVGEMNSLLRRETDVGLKVLDLFCGAGGLSLGFWACGFEVVGIDHNSDATSTYSNNLGSAVCITLDEESSLPHADVIIAGPPCQPWSRAGKRLGRPRQARWTRRHYAGGATGPSCRSNNRERS